MFKCRMDVYDAWYAYYFIQIYLFIFTIEVFSVLLFILCFECGIGTELVLNKKLHTRIKKTTTTTSSEKYCQQIIEIVCACASTIEK